ncbi:tripartite motif-containing protein 2-like [Anneissia japonica]|uniref:tripartite motif-containing protein 2-like n=1 Tax=Anneissia japonica TaxID=1529436 RepID=UPI001425B309|nr:tripartite motif-containing protein 2-like [Anneissia japonica]
MMATGMLNQCVESLEEEKLECKICFKKIQNPKSLSCRHTFCLACLEDLVDTKGKLICQICTEECTIPESGLQELPQNELLQNPNKFQKGDKKKCVCEKDNQVKSYCLDCRLHLCTTCTDHHTKFPVMANHKLQMLAPEDQLPVNPLLCSSVHGNSLEFYCIHCKIPVDYACKNEDHQESGGKHKVITISEAFQKFKGTAIKLKEEVNDFTKKLEESLQKIAKIEEKLEDCKATCLKDIENIVQELVLKINGKGEEMKNKVETIYKKKKLINSMQKDELRKAISDVENLLGVLNDLINGDETIAMQSSNEKYKELKRKLDESPYTGLNDDGQIYFFKNISSLQWKCDIGNVTETMADRLALIGGHEVTQGQPIVVKVCKTDEYEIEANQMSAEWIHPTGETNIAKVDDDGNGDYTVTGKCTSPGICKLDVRVGGEPIRQSPMSIKVNKEGLVHTIKIEERIVSDVILWDGNHMLISCRTKYIFVYKDSGAYVGKIKLPEGVKVNRMYKMKNGNIVYSDYGNKFITIYNKMNGQVIKTIGQGELSNPKGLHVDESSNVVCVADWNNICVFNIDSGQMIRRIQSERNVPDITVTKGGNVIVLYDHQPNALKFQNTKQQCILQVLDNEFKFLKNIVAAEGKMKPRGVAVDADDNIIISSQDKLELFSNDGNFIKRIDNEKDGINIPWGLSISNHPRRVAVANNGKATIQIYNY